MEPTEFRGRVLPAPDWFPTEPPDKHGKYGRCKLDTGSEYKLHYQYGWTVEEWREAEHGLLVYEEFKLEVEKILRRKGVMWRFDWPVYHRFKPQVVEHDGRGTYQRMVVGEHGIREIGGEMRVCMLYNWMYKEGLLTTDFTVPSVRTAPLAPMHFISRHSWGIWAVRTGLTDELHAPLFKGDWKFEPSKVGEVHRMLMRERVGLCR